MYFNRKNAEQKNWRMIKKGKHFLFGCSLVFAVGAALVAPSVKADTVETKPEAGSTTETTKPTIGEGNGTYVAPAVEVAPTSPVASAAVVAEEKAEKPVETTQNSKEEPVVATEKAKEADSIQAPEVTVVYDPSALTDEEKAKVVAAVKAANPTATDVQVQADGSVVVIFADGSSANLTAAQTIKDGSLVAKPRTNRAARATATRASEGAENLDYSNKEDVEGYVKISYEVDKANNVIHWTVLDNPGRKGNSASGYVYFTIPKGSVGEPTNWKVVQTDKNGKVVNSRDYWKDNDGSYLMGQKGRMNTYTGAEMTKRLTQLYKDTKNPAIKGNEAAVAAQTAERSQALYTMTADNNAIRNVMWTITYDTPILDNSKPLDYVAGMQGTGLVGGRTNIMTGFTDNYIDNASSKFQAVAVKEKYTAKVGGSFAADPATYVTNKAGTPEFPNNYRGATSFKWKDGQAPTATEAGTYTKTVVVTYPAHYKQAPQEVTITFEVKGNEASEIKEPAKTPVQDLTNLTQPEKDKVKKAIEDANPGKVANVVVGNDGAATVTFNDGSEATLTPDKTVVEAQSKGIQAPTKTPVQDLTNLTQPEKDAVKKAIEDANPGKVANVVVGNDGAATVTFNDGSEATLTPDKTVVEAESKGIQAPTKTPVQDLTNLTQPEKDKVKKAIEDANPGKVANVVVGNDGTATVTFNDGSEATLTPDKTVVEAQSKGIQAPAKTPVQDLTNLTQPEKDKVKKAIEDANPGKVANVVVGNDGTATVTFNDGSEATLTPDKTVVEAQSKGIQAPTKTPVQDLTNLTQPEKDKVKKAIEDANPGKVANVVVGNDGTATVTFNDGSEATLTPDKTVVEAQSKGIQAPTKTPVQDLTNLTQPEKDKVKKAIEDANPGKVANVVVGNDGTATVTFNDGSEATLTPDKTVVEAQSKGIQAPTKTPVQDLTNLTQPEKDKVKKAIEDANPGKVANVVVGNDGTATVTFNDGSEATLTPDKTVVEAESKGIQAPTKTPVQDLTNLTQPEKDAVKKAIEDANPGKVANVVVGNDGSATVTFKDGSEATLTPDKTVEKATKDADGIVNPAKTPVADPTNLTQPEKDAVKKAIEDANPGKVANVVVGNDGSATVTFKDGSEATLTPDKTVEKATKDADGIVNPAKTPVADPTNLTQPEKDAVKKAIEDANPGKVANVVVGNDGSATVTFKDGSEATLTPDKTVEKATKDADGIVNPAKTPVADPTNLTQPEKDTVKKAIEDANPGKVANVVVGNDGSATVTFKDGSEATLTPDKTVEKATKDADGIVNPAKTPVADPTNLTQPEKDTVKKAIEDANPGKVANVVVGNDGSATVTFKDGSEATLTPDKTVEKATKDADGIVNPAKTPVADPTNLTQPEKDAVKKAIEDANPGKVANVVVGNDGSATVTFKDGSEATLTPDKTVEKATKDADGIVNPAKTPVADPTNLTQPEKDTVKKAIEDANPGKVANVVVGNDGSATVTFKDGSEATLTPDKTVEKATKDADGIVNPAKTPVQDLTNLTQPEKDKVKKAIEDANPGKVANVVVGNDGTATVTFNDGSEATLTPDKTVVEAESKGIQAPTKTPVQDLTNLTQPEKDAVKKAIEDANPGKVANVVVGNDGSATVTFKDGSEATLTPDKTVEKATKDADGIVNPAKTPVADPTNLTQPEKDAVKKAIEDANPGKVANVVVGNDGSATVTFKDGSEATLTPDKTVEKATKDADGIVNPAKTPVADPTNLTQPEKDAVKKAIEDANPGKVANVVVGNDGSATVTFKDGSEATLTPDKTVEKATKDADGIVNPAKTPVADPTNLTQPEKDTVKKAIEDANPGKVANVVVGNDGSATVTFKDGSEATLTPDKTVEKATKDADGIVNPAKTPVADPTNLTQPEKDTVKKAIEDANPGKVANVVVGNDGSATVTFKDGSEATLTPDKTVEKATKDADGIVNPAKTPVADPTNLTQPEKDAVKKAIEDANPGKVANVVVGNDGSATVTFKDGSEATLTPDKTVEKATKDADGIVNPAKTPVADPTNLTQPEKDTVKKAIEDANPGKVANVVVGNDGSATVTFKDGSEATLTPDKTVEKATKDADGIVNPAKTPVADPTNLTQPEKDAVKKAIEDANPGKVANVVVGNDGSATVTFKDGSEATLTPDKTVEKATKDADGIVNPAKTPVADPTNLTQPEKDTVKKAIEDANPGKVANVVVGNDGSATVTFKDGSEATLTPDKTVEKATKDADGIVNPAKTPVADPTNLTQPEKDAVKKAIEDANPGKVANVVVGNDGSATVTFKDGSEATLTPDKTVEKATKDADGIVNPAKTPVADPTNLTQPEKDTVKKAIEDANPGKVANVVVGNDGSATVTFKDGSEATLTPDKTVEKATKDADGIVNPAKTPVADPTNLTQPEKDAVKKAIEDANPGKVANVVVGNDGSATVTFKDGSEATLTPDKTVEKATKDADGIVNPAKTPVADPTNLTQPEKDAVKKAIEDANPGKVANVVVGNDGSATVTFKDGSEATLTPDKTVEKATKDADGIVNPAKTPVADPTNLTQPEKDTVKKAIEDANPGKVANVVVGNDGSATVTFKDGSEATLTPDKTVEKATKDADGIVNPAKTPVADPTNLTQPEKDAVKKAIEDANPGKVANVVVGNDGSATVTFKDGSEATLTPDKTVEKATKDADGIVNPAKTPVADPTNLTQPEKDAVKKAIEDANPGKVANVVVGNDGSATVTFKDGSEATLTPDKTVEKATKDADGIVNPAKTPVADPTNLTQPEKDAVKKAIEDANPGKVANVVVGNDGSATVTFKDGSEATLTPDKTVEKATKDADGIVNPAKTPVADPTNLTQPEKDAVKKAIEDANPGKVANVVVGNDGSATVTFKDGSEATLTPDKTVEKATKDADGIVNPAKTPVADPTNLTQPEKDAVKKAIEDANPGKVANVVVGNDGSATVTFKDGSEATLTPAQTVKEADSNGVKTPAVTPVVNPSSLTDAEKAKVAEEVKKSNPTATDVKVGEDGTATVTFKDGSEATLTPAQTVKEADSNGVKTPAVTPVVNPSSLTDAEKAKVAEEVKKSNPTATDVKVGEDGTATVIFPDGSKATLTPAQTVKEADSNGVKTPAVTPVVNPSALTDAEKAKVAEEVKKSNPTATDVKVGEDGTATVIFPDGSKATLTPAQTVKEADSNGVKTPAVTPVVNPSSLTDAEKAKVAEEVKKSNPTATDIKVNNDGSVVVTFADGSVAVLASENVVKEATKESPAQEPAKKAGAKELPNTGTKQSNASLGLALLAAVTGGLLIAKKREEEE